MTTRVARARSLADELLVCLERFEAEVRGPDAVLFLDRLARCESFEPQELKQAQAADVVAKAREVRDSAGPLLGEGTASAIDVEGLLERGYAIASGSDEDTGGFAITALILATVAQHLPKAARARALEACDELVALVEGNPGYFGEAAFIGEDRAQFERPSRMPEPARRLIRAFRDAPALEARDEEHASQPVPESSREIVARAMDRAQRQPFWNEFAADAAALSAKIVELLEAATAVRSFALSAASAAESSHVPLRRAFEGSFFLVRSGADVTVEWQGPDPMPELWRERDSGWSVLSRSEVEGGVQWKLELPARGARLQARIGPNTVSMELP